MNGTATDIPSAPDTVLVVEDEPAILGINRLVLERAGYVVLVAADGPTAIDLFRASPGRVSAVVLDVNLPGLTGWEVLAELRRLQPGIRVVITSGEVSDESKTSAAGDVPTAVLPKPFRPTQLTEIVARVLAAP